MFKNLRELFTSGLVESGGSGEAEGDHGLMLATGALLVEMVRADHHIDEREMQVVAEALSGVFSLSADEALEIIELAGKDVDESVSLYEFTRMLNEELSPERKVEVIELLWRVAYADAKIEKYEEYLVRKVADLLYVPHREYIQARHRVEEGR